MPTFHVNERENKDETETQTYDLCCEVGYEKNTEGDEDGCAS